MIIFRKKVATISIIRLIIRSETVSVERFKRYVLSGAIGIFTGIFFMYAARLVLYGAGQLTKYVF